MPKNENVGVALALVFGAGASTAVGAAVVFFPSLVKRTSRRVLAASLGFSAGVMGYVSFVEIFAKSTGSFEDAGFDKSDAYVYSTLCFFGGVIAMIVSPAMDGTVPIRIADGGWRGGCGLLIPSGNWVKGGIKSASGKKRARSASNLSNNSLSAQCHVRPSCRIDFIFCFSLPSTDHRTLAPTKNERSS